MRRSHILVKCFVAIMIVACAALPAKAQTQISSDLRQKIDKLAAEALASTGSPSASVAVVKDGHIVYLQAYGDARLEPRTSAKPEMRYKLGSVGKPFVAAAILLLQEQGKLSLDDKVSKFIPGLTRANEVTIRNLLSHTSGYQEFWTVDYVLPMMLQPVTPRKVIDQWARRPLNFDPGTKWQISDTNFMIAGMIVEKASGMPFHQFLQEKIFAPLAMASVANVNEQSLGANDPEGYIRYALGPLHPAPREARGWLFAGEELAMTAQDLARWDVSVIDENLMKPASYRDLETLVLLKNGSATPNALAFGLSKQAGHRLLYNLGDVSGFGAANMVFPDERAAVVVLANQDTGAPGEIARGVASLLLATEDSAAPQKLELARRIFDGFQHGTIDRSLFTDDANSYLCEQALKDFAAGLSPLGTPQGFDQVDRTLAHGMTIRTYRIKFARKTLTAHTAEMPGGKLEQFLIEDE